MPKNEKKKIEKNDIGESGRPRDLRTLIFFPYLYSKWHFPIMVFY